MKLLILHLQLSSSKICPNCQVLLVFLKVSLRFILFHLLAYSPDHPESSLTAELLDSQKQPVAIWLQVATVCRGHREEADITVLRLNITWYHWNIMSSMTICYTVTSDGINNIFTPFKNHLSLLIFYQSM